MLRLVHSYRVVGSPGFALDEPSVRRRADQSLGALTTRPARPVSGGPSAAAGPPRQPSPASSAPAEPRTQLVSMPPSTGMVVPVT